MCSAKCSELASIICRKLNVEYEDALLQPGAEKTYAHISNSGDCSSLRCRTTTTQGKDYVLINVELLGVTRCRLPCSNTLPYLQSFAITNTFKHGYFIHVSLNLEFPCSLMEESDSITTLIRLIAGQESLNINPAKTTTVQTKCSDIESNEPLVPMHTSCVNCKTYKLKEDTSPAFCNIATAHINNLLFCARDEKTIPEALTHYYSWDKDASHSNNKETWFTSTGVDVITSGILTRLKQNDLYQHAKDIHIALYVHR